MTVLRHHRRSDTSPPVDPERCRSVVDGTRRCDRISPVLRQLHWPPVRQRVEFKVAVLVHRAFTRHAPNCLTDDCCLVTDARPRRLRSADTRTLLASRTRTNFGDRAFIVAGPCVSGTICRPTSDSRFRRSQKTFLFCLWDQIAVLIHPGPHPPCI